jgi:hypothetical protein
MGGVILPLPYTSSLYGAYLIKYGDEFTDELARSANRRNVYIMFISAIQSHVFATYPQNTKISMQTVLYYVGSNRPLIILILVLTGY